MFPPEQAKHFTIIVRLLYIYMNGFPYVFEEIKAEKYPSRLVFVT